MVFKEIEFRIYCQDFIWVKISSNKYMHNNYCCHRDLKPNNILCMEDSTLIKLQALILILNNNNQIFRFQNLLMAIKNYKFKLAWQNRNVDLGVILYVKLSGELPFSSFYLNNLIDQIQKCNYQMTGPIWDKISITAKDLISNL